jgi:hypothetical protein
MKKDGMESVGLARWQWDGYPLYHQARTNLLIHILLVPVFLAGNIALLAGIVRLSWPAALAGFAAMAISFAVQGYGHGREANPSIPFSGPANAFARIFLEQWVTFPRFFLSGGWTRALRSAPLRFRQKN